MDTNKSNKESGKLLNIQMNKLKEKRINYKGIIVTKNSIWNPFLAQLVPFSNVTFISLMSIYSTLLAESVPNILNTKSSYLYHRREEIDRKRRLLL